MPAYLTSFSCTSAVGHEMVQSAEGCEAAARTVIEANGGTLGSFCSMFGDHGGLAISETPDRIVAATVLAGINSSGRIEPLATRSLLPGDEAQTPGPGQVRRHDRFAVGRAVVAAARVRESRPATRHRRRKRLRETGRRLCGGRRACSGPPARRPGGEHQSGGPPSGGPPPPRSAYRSLKKEAAKRMAPTTMNDSARVGRFKFGMS
jgi:uncharacterized protein with GYD domain